ncbi:MAG: hydrogenase nickel incorporation protein HypB [Planctomycetota bacterium]
MHEPAFEEVEIGKKILAANSETAEQNRNLFKKHKLFVVNIMGSPGAGKTTLLEKTITQLKEMKIAVIEGDIEGDSDRKRAEAAGAINTYQINTHGACHLLAHQIEHSLEKININTIDLLIIENIGNLVCPAEFDLGESAKVMILGITEGADKPLKYPLMFKNSNVLLLNKIDLLDHSGCDIESLKENIRKVNPDVKIMGLSCRTGDGMKDWITWLQEKINESRKN